MIYGFPGDGNLSRLMTTMRSLPIAPMFGDGGALQQPVFYRDLGDITAGLLTAKEWRPGAYAVAGPQPDTLRELYGHVRAAARATCAIAPIPPAPIAALTGLAEKIGLKPPLTRAQIARGKEDKTPRGDAPILANTPLKEGLDMLARALDESRGDA
jgi:uncharacterized protein YbjT (DUF2867 family)